MLVMLMSTNSNIDNNPFLKIPFCTDENSSLYESWQHFDMKMLLE